MQINIEEVYTKKISKLMADEKLHLFIHTGVMFLNPSPSILGREVF